MCGIAGFIDFSFRSNEEVLRNMTDCLIHRGPDDSGIEIFNNDFAKVGFGFRRLSIIDLSANGHQPMQSANGKHTIVFNGEIYNYREIKLELEKLGCSFKSNSDTEVILQSYIRWGKSCVEKLNGMFAFSIYDSEKNQVLFFRDRAGVKPFFYYWHNNVFLFASELKAFHEHPLFKKELNVDAIALYFQHGYIPAPHCIFNYCNKLQPGSVLVFSISDKTFFTDKYWDVTDAYHQPKLKIDFEEAKSETERVLQKAFNYRMIADVPVGIFLSGGYDSSLLAALLQKDSLQKLKTFTIGFEEAAFNEAPYAKKVAEHLGTQHNEYTCTYKEAMDIIPMLPKMYDEPFADSSAIPTYLVSKMARQQVTVALSADGGDETFAGYTKYDKGIKYIITLNSIPAVFASVGAASIGLLQKLFASSNLATPDRVEKIKLILKSKNAVEAFNIITQAMTRAEVRQLFKVDVSFPDTAFEEELNLFGASRVHTPNPSRSNTVHRTEGNAEVLDNFLWLDYKTFMVDDVLQKVDRASMAVSLEAREPFLDYHIIEWAAQLPSAFKLNGNTGKHILREITHQYLPKELMDRGKMGFQVPIENWLRKEQKDLLLAFTSKELIEKYGILNSKEVEKIIAYYLAGKPNLDFSRIYKILMLQMWLDEWI